MTSMLQGFLIVLGCVTGIFIVTRLRKQAGLRNVRLSSQKSLAIAAVTATIVSAAFLLLYLLGGLPPGDQSIGAVLGLCLVVWLGVFGFFCVFEAISRSRKSLRGTEALGVMSVLVVTGVLFYGHHPGADRFLVFCFPGVLIGVVAGILSVPAMKRRIVGDRIILRRRFPDNLTFRESLVYWKETLLVVIGAGVGLLLFKRVSLSDSVLGMILGFALGMSCYRFLWVCGYERKNGIRITIHYTESEKISEPSKA